MENKKTQIKYRIYRHSITDVGDFYYKLDGYKPIDCNTYEEAEEKISKMEFDGEYFIKKVYCKG